MRERKETLIEILSAKGLLNQEQIELLKSKEALQRSKILKSETPGMRQNIFDQSAIMKIIAEFYGFKSAITSAGKDIDTQTDLGNLEQYVKLKSITRERV